MTRRRQPRSLRTRLVVSAVALIAVVCAVIGTVTTIALRSHLYDQLDKSLAAVAMRASGPMPKPGAELPGVLSGDGDEDAANDPLRFVSKGPQELGTIGAVVEDDGSVGQALVSNESDSGSIEPQTEQLDGAQSDALGSVPRDGDEHNADIPGLGEYRVVYTAGPNGDFLVGIPTAKVQNTLETLIIVEVSVTAAGLVAASLTGAVMVGVALRPLRRVAATATRVSELPLHSGEVALYERVPDTEPNTEVGQVGAALNRMLDHVHSALHARQESETRVRQFVADASHELRTPLASIRGYAELTRRGRESTGPDTRHALGRIESEAQRMSGLVEDLLLLARLDEGRDEGRDGTRSGTPGRPGARLPLSYESTDLSPLVVDTVSDARAAGPGHYWALELPDEPALVLADPARLQQVVVNLLANARTHTPPGTKVTARVRRAGPGVCLEVEDNGPGIAPALLPHVFERFARGDASRSRNAGSTGLGLALVQAIVEAHGGGVEVESVPGRTVFTVALPAVSEQVSGPSRHSQAGHSLTTQA
ncbi:two-component sensor histidine kinase [Streptomyces longisporoflavus]|uniref:sensor histidine kinase n=1 Tax=Streptomyces longisporoflavus TaxID=28044 RepID=UPI00167E5C2A|nr:HAMP domain-containing sensor histidine kinase [Streptomyces longisporoflavus]GGV49156.1 two-component sensor histidine kinase [Streptomyces longisporoflavus]